MEATSNGEMEIQLINTDRIDMREHGFGFWQAEGHYEG